MLDDHLKKIEAKESFYTEKFIKIKDFQFWSY